MITVASFALNAWSENTYVLYDETKECVIIDPGCSDAMEQEVILNLIQWKELKPVHLLNTHCHIDHILGNRFIGERYNLPLTIHKGELPVLEMAPVMAKMFGVEVEPYPASKFLEEGDIVTFGNAKLEVLYTPGHSPASISFYCKEDGIVIAGDVLFQESIGRHDLPGGDLKVLLTSIKEQLFPLGDEVVVYPGHGPHTTIGHEKKHNPVIAHYSGMV